MQHAHQVSEHPRAFYPDFTDHAPAPRRTPGWDVELERRIDDGRTLVRGLAWSGIGLAALGLVFRGDNPRRGNVLTAMAAVAGVAALGIMAAAQFSESPAGDRDRRYIQ